MARGKATGRYGPSRRGRQSEDTTSRWLGTYGDAVTLLMAFFVMLYAMAEVDVQKFTAFVSGLEGPFGNTSAVEMLDRLPAIVGDAGAETPTSDPGAVTSPPGVPLPELPVPDRAADQQPEGSADEAKQQLADVLVELSEVLASAGLDDVASYDVQRRGLVLSIAADDVLFATGSAELSPAGREILRAVAEPLRDIPNDLVIEGHTDDRPLQRPGYTNWNLSTDRAVSVLTMFYAELGIPQERLGAAGYGEHRPRASNADEVGRAANRRVDIVIAALTEPQP
jgi:chemotaxis protein MotB